MAEIQVVRLAHRLERVARILRVLAVALALFPAVTLALGSAALWELAASLFAASIPVALFTLLAEQGIVSRGASLRREDDDIVVQRDGRPRRYRVSRENVAGIVVPDARGAMTVEVALAGGDTLAAEVRDLAEAEALLGELRVDARNRRSRVRIADRTAARVVAMLAPFGIALLSAIVFADMLGPRLAPLLARIPTHGAWALGVAAYVVTMMLLHGLLATSDVTVGTDGLAFRRLFRDGFVPLADVEDVSAGSSGALIHRRSGGPLLLFSLVGVSSLRVGALRLRIREAMALGSLGEGRETPAAEALDRGARSVHEWRAALSALLRRGEGYRSAGLSEEALETVLASPDAPVERRLGAALALSVSKEPIVRDRIRFAAAGCANEKLRVALEKLSVGEEDDTSLAEVLEDVETAAPARARVA